MHVGFLVKVFLKQRLLSHTSLLCILYFAARSNPPSASLAVIRVPRGKVGGKPSSVIKCSVLQYLIVASGPGDVTNP